MEYDGAGAGVRAVPVARRSDEGILLGGGRRRRRVIRWVAGLVLAGLVASSGDRHEPPRFDGAGYATLGLALAQGRGYREISRPDAPRHAHFPPGYPALLALIARGVGTGFDRRPSVTVAAHLASLALILLGFAGFARWWRRVVPPGVALPLTVALAVNWTWVRAGGAIRSEPLAIALSGLALLGAGRLARARVRRVAIARAAALAVALALGILTRHVLVCLALAVGVDLARRRGWRLGAGVLLGMAVLVAPWVAWQRSAGGDGGGSQWGLFRGSDPIGLIADQALFYARRLPDVVVGPVVEVATVFTWVRLLGPAATLVAVVVAGLMLVGWVRLARSDRASLGGLVPLLTLPLLLIWPFTEAGRFLVPLVPFVLMGLVEGLAVALGRLGVGRARVRAAWIVALLAVPYPTYAVAAGRFGAERARQGGFDAACRWLADPARAGGPVMARHAADVAWLTGRPAVPIPDGGAAAIAAEVARWGVVFLVADRDRYALSPETPLESFGRDPTRARPVWRDEAGSITISRPVPSSDP